MKRRKVRTAVLGLMALLMWSGSMAAEEIYLHGDTNIPMILNTGGIDNDGNTGVFMDLTSISVEDLFKNGLAVKVNFFKLEKGVPTVSTAHPPMTVSPEKEKTELTAVKVKGNVQREEDAQKNEEGEITEQVEISIVSHPVVEIISKSDAT